jgi:hypothetical protein
MALRDIMEECQCFQETPDQVLTGAVRTTNYCKTIATDGCCYDKSHYIALELKSIAVNLCTTCFTIKLCLCILSCEFRVVHIMNSDSPQTEMGNWPLTGTQSVSCEVRTKDINLTELQQRVSCEVRTG